MIRKLKICMIGATGVGKTSLVSRFVTSIFSERYETTIGVKIHARTLRRGDDELRLVLWDLSGEDEFQSLQPAYLRGASGYLLVVDGTRRDTLEAARALQARTREAIGDVPFVVVLNKADLVATWELRERDTKALEQRGWPFVLTSAKTGDRVDRAFDLLIGAILQPTSASWT